jgi:hypothetical protein
MNSQRQWKKMGASEGKEEGVAQIYTAGGAEGGGGGGGGGEEGGRRMLMGEDGGRPPV